VHCKVDTAEHDNPNYQQQQTPSGPALQMLDALALDLVLQPADLALGDHSLVRPAAAARRSSKHSENRLLCAIVWELLNRFQEYRTLICTKYLAHVKPPHNESTHFNSSNGGIHHSCM
jgi:hypothetical protein